MVQMAGAVLRIRDIYLGSRILILDPTTATKEEREKCDVFRKIVYI
jgi:hypothetical protein